MNLREEVVSWIRANGISDYWLLHLFNHLIERGASPGDALAAMNLFVDDAIRAKHRRLRT